MLYIYYGIPDTYSLPVRPGGSPGQTGSFRGYRPALSSWRGNRRLGTVNWRLFLIFIVLLWGGQTGLGLAQIGSVGELTEKMQDAYDKTRDLKARFIQEVTIKSMNKTEREEGTVWIKNPKMMYWDYSKPKVKKLIINATNAWLYVAEDRMAYLQNADDIYRSRIAVKFLSGIGKLSEDFSVRFPGEGHTDKNGNFLLKLTAKEKGSGLDQIDLTIDKKTFHIIQCRFDDDYGNITRLNFSNIQTNTAIADSFFVFRPPADVEIVKMP
jgi:outer membrane lipoprotein carrier protein